MPRVSPVTSPRASGSHQGEPSPVSAGTKTTPPVDSTLRASASLSAASPSTPRPSRSHWIAAPLDEHRALERVPVGGGGLQQPVRRRCRVVARVDEHEAARAVGRLRPRPAAWQPWPKSAACWSPAIPRISDAPAEQLALAHGLVGARRSAAAASGRRRTARAARRPSRASRASASMRARGVRPVGDVHLAAGQLPDEPACRRCRTRGPAGSRARAAATRASSPRSTDRGRARCARGSARRRARGSASAVRRSCQTIAGATGRPVARSHSSVVSRWFVIAIVSTSAASPALRAAAARSTLCQISSGSCSTQPGRGKLLRQLAVAAAANCAGPRRPRDTSCPSCPGRSRGSRVLRDELERSLPGVVGRLRELLLLAIEEAVRRAVVDDDLVLDACFRRAPARTPRCPRP